MKNNKIMVIIYGNDFQSNPKGDDSEVLIKALGTGKLYNAELYSDDDAKVGALSTGYTISPLGGDLVGIHSTNEYINDIDYLYGDFDRDPLTWGGMNFLHAVEMVRMIKKYSVRKPQIWIEEGDHYFAYTMYLKGKTVGEVFSKLTKMYVEAEANLPVNINVLKKRMLNTK